MSIIRHGIFALLVAAIGYGCIHLAGRGAISVERLLVDRVENGLSVLGIDWAEVRADGLHLELHGHAPDIFARDLALESARATASIAVVIDHMSVSLAPPARRDPIQVEIMRDERGLTLTGRFHGETMRSELIVALGASAPGLDLHDLTGINAARPGADWGPELAIAALAAARLPNAYIRFEPGAVHVGGLVRDAEHREAVSLELLTLAGDRVRLALQLREPLVVTVPFVFAVSKDASGGLRLEACAARSVEEEAVLESALNRNGVSGGENRCHAALGGPSGDWAGASKAGLEALNRLSAGRFRLEYHTAQLEAAEPVESEELEQALAVLAGSLPHGFVLLGGFDKGMAGQEAELGANRYWMRFNRTTDTVVLRGTVPDRTARRVIETYAAARFGQAALHSVLSAVDAAGERVPTGWEAAALVALDALGSVSEGEAELSPQRIRVAGTVANPVKAGLLHRLMEGEAPAGIAVETALTIDLPGQVAKVPLSARRCAIVLTEAILAQPVVFAPGSAVFGAGSDTALDRLGAIFRRCEGGRIEIGGHTDSQGSRGLNQRLSLARADAVVDGLIERGVPLDRLGARGYGEGQPVAGNDTEQGRALNRRIAFTVLEDADGAKHEE